MYLLAATIVTYLLNLRASLRPIKRRLYEGLFGLCLIILMGANDKNADFFTYQWLYNAHIAYGEPGYRLLSYFGQISGLDYEQFRLLLVAIFMVILYVGVSYLTVHTAGFMALYFCYPFFLDLIQLRNFMMMALLVYASHFLLGKSTRNLLLFIAFVLLGASFQVLGALYLLVVPLYYFDARHLGKISLLGGTFLLALIVLFPAGAQFLLRILNQLPMGHVSLYFVQKVRLGYLPFWLFSLFDLSLTYFSYQYLTERRLLTAKQRQVIWIAFTFAVVGVLTMPLYTYEFSFARALRDVVPFMVITYLVTLEALPQENYLHWLYCGGFGLYGAGLIYFEMVPLLHNTIIPAFSNNWLIK
ncbi:EpsG family protein [Loigolactobacillus binensis]|uniref:EpsG family protein n=1 Tax=Loigolactobacillus binensis TaxID=2559922 RepID=A0ABW3EA89_9LACO|nr:EpsG family protein [Loigolactobacillus binensis]